MSNSLLNLGVSGLNAALWGLTTTGQNISNAATPGYSVERPVYAEASGQYTSSGYLPQGVNTVTVQRCGESVTYTRPQRAIAYEGGSADKLFSLGLTDRVRGYVMPPANPPVSESPWAAEYAKVELLSDDLLNKEIVVDAKGDLVVAGWNSGFSDRRGITPEILDGLGIGSFMHAESCFNYPGFPERHRPFDGLYVDLERLGRIFGVEDRAAAVITGLR